MEITFRKIRIRNYIRASLLRSEKNAEALFIAKFNPLYNWRVGSLKADQIKDALNYSSAKNELPANIRANSVTAKAFSLLLDIYNDKVKKNKVNSLSIQDWLEVRKNYETAIKKEYETSFGKIGFNENIDYSKKKKGKAVTDADDSSDSGNYSVTTNNEEQAEEVADEIAFASVTSDEIESMLDEMHQGNWVVRIFSERKENFNHHIAILNLHLPEQSKNKILNEALSKVQEYLNINSEASSLEIKSIQGNSFIDGYFSVADS